MDAKQTVIDYIEGRIEPRTFEALLDGESGDKILDWLQSIVPEGTMREEAVQMDWDALWDRTPDELRKNLNEAARKIEESKKCPFEERFQLAIQMTKLMRQSLEYIQCIGGSLELVLDNFEQGIAGAPHIPETYVQAIPDMMLDMLEQQEWARIEVPYDVRVFSRKMRGEGRLGDRLNLHNWVTNLVKQYCPEIVLKVDDTLDKKFEFMLDVCPEYIDGLEVEKSGILERIIAGVPEDMPKGKRKKLIKERIKEAFHIEKKYPRWIQSPEWPMFGDKPMKFIKTVKKHDGELLEHHFVDVDTGEERVVEDFA